MATDDPKEMFSDLAKKSQDLPEFFSNWGEGMKRSFGFVDRPEEPAASPMAPAPVAPPVSSPAKQASPMAVPPALAPSPMPTRAAPAPAAIPMVEHTSQQTFSRPVVDKQAEAKLQGAQADYQAAIIEGGKIGAQQAAVEAAHREETVKNLQAQDATAAQKQIDDQARVDEALTAQKSLLDDLATTKKDPERYWKNKGTGARGLAGIGVALGAFGAALTGTRNTAFDMINKAIEQDLDAQDSELAVKKDKIAAQGNLIAQLRQKGFDGATSRSLARQNYLDNSRMDLEAKISKLRPEQIGAAAQQTVEQLRVASAAEEEKRKQGAVTTMKAMAPAFSPADAAKRSDEERKRFVPGVNAIALTEDDAKLMKAYNADHTIIVGDIEKLKELVDTKGNESFGQAKAKMIQLKRRITTAMNKEAGLGAMSGSDRELIEDQIADPTVFFARGSKTSELLGELIGTFKRARENRFSAYGLVQ